MWFDTSSNPRHSVVEGFSAPASPLGPCPALRASSVRRHSERISANGGGAMPITDEGSTETVTTVDRRTLAFCRWGDPDGAPVFYLHGTPGSRFLRHSEDEYRRNRLCVYTYDRPGFGLSTRLRGRKIADTAADVRAIADAVGLGEFGVAGVSGGAAPALACGALLPDRVTRCATVVGAAPFTAEGLDVFDGMDEEARTEWALPLRGEEAIERDWLETVDWIEQGLPGVDAPDEVRAMLLVAFEEATRQGSHGFVDDMLSEAREWGFSLSDVRAPTRLMMARDDVIPAAHGDWLVQRLPNARVVWVDGGHFGPRDEPEMELMTWVGHGEGGSRVSSGVSGSTPHPGGPSRTP